MHAVVRTYSGKGAKEFGALLAKHKKDVEQLMRSVQGFASYTLAHTSDGCVSMTICESRAGVEESTHKAREWLAANATHTGVGPAAVSEGAVILHL